MWHIVFMLLKRKFKLHQKRSACVNNQLITVYKTADSTTYEINLNGPLIILQTYHHNITMREHRYAPRMYSTLKLHFC